MVTQIGYDEVEVGKHSLVKCLQLIGKGYNDDEAESLAKQKQSELNKLTEKLMSWAKLEVERMVGENGRRLKI